MSRLAKLAIVGRPNVGKSALFNRICKKRIAIVDEAEGITRDRIYGTAELFGFPFTVIDTGGIDIQSKAPFNSEIKRQAEIAIEEADSLILVVDCQVGLTELDHQIARILLRAGKPVCLAVNKVDDRLHEDLLHQFHPLGIKEMVTVSAAQNYQIAELLETAWKGHPKEIFEVEEEHKTKIAIIGRPNVGKSTLVNALLEDNRCIVSPIAGTTRDSIDVDLEWEGKQYTLIDTAGIRRKHSEHEVVDKFASMRTQLAIERSDVCILVLDSTQGLTTQEKHIAGLIEEAGKGCVMLFNKWDLVHGFRMEHCLKGIQESAPFLSHCPTLFGSALTKRNLEKIIALVDEVYDASKMKISTPQLNRFIEQALQRNHPPMLQGKRLRIYYMVQIGSQPPEFLLFVNHATLMMDTYKKYLLNQFRDTFGFSGNPIILRLKNKPQRKKERDREDDRAQVQAHYHSVDDQEDDWDEEE